MRLDKDFLRLLSLLKGVLHRTETEGAVDVDGVFETAQRQAVEGMLYDIPHAVLAQDSSLRLQRAYRLTVVERQSRWMDGQVATLARKLDEHHVRYAVMKGQTCAAFYPHPEHRRCGDIDVYVVPRDFDRANQLLADWGFRLTDRTMLHATYQYGKLIVELHFAIQKLQYAPYYRQLRQITSEEFDTDTGKDTVIPIGGYPVRTLPDELNVLLLTTHAFNHVITAGLGLRQIIDWQVVLSAKHATLRWDKLMGWLDALRLRRMFLVLAHINVRHLGMDRRIFTSRGLDIDAKPVQRMAERLLAWVEVCGNFGHSMDLGTGQAYFLRYYGLFLLNLVRFFPLNPMEMMAWPWTKAYRAITHTNHL